VITAEKAEVLRCFAEGRKLYKAMDFVRAKEYFEAALKADKDDGPSRVYLDRCQQLIDNPPPADWDGVFVMKTK